MSKKIDGSKANQINPLPYYHYVDQGGNYIQTNHGTMVKNDDGSLKAGTRGPVLLQDQILREKITHFDHERIPERVVHARGSGVHGFFTCTSDILRPYTDADVFINPHRRTPMFVRYSTVLGSLGNMDCIRDTRGFAMRFYTDDGHFDLVGNNMPIFFINDGMKFPDIIHATKPEPDHGMPQGSTAHDTAWDFFSMHPQTTHNVMYNMSPRGLPYSFAHMNAFGIHTFHLVKEHDNGVLRTTNCKFIAKPRAGLAGMSWNEAQIANGTDPDFHRRKLHETVSNGGVIEYDFYVQILPDDDTLWKNDRIEALDATKYVPEELYPFHQVGVITLNRACENRFAEVEQVAFCPAHVVKGIGISNDPLLHSRMFSYLDTQLLRLGVNFMQIPINRPRSHGCPYLSFLQQGVIKKDLQEIAITPTHTDDDEVVQHDDPHEFKECPRLPPRSGRANYNNQRDGQMQMYIHKNGIAYQPNVLNKGLPAGNLNTFDTYPHIVAEHCPFLKDTDSDEQSSQNKGSMEIGKGEHKQHATMTREFPPTFTDYHIQPRAFYHSLAKWERAQLMSALVFELQGVKSYQVRSNVVHNMLLGVDTGLAKHVAEQIDITIDPELWDRAVKYENNHNNTTSNQSMMPYKHYISPSLSFGHPSNKVTSLAHEWVLIIINDKSFQKASACYHQWIHHLKRLFTKKHQMCVQVTAPGLVAYDGITIVDKPLDALTSVHFHTMVVISLPDEDEDMNNKQSLGKSIHARRLIEEAYRHGKALGEIRLNNPNNNPETCVLGQILTPLFANLGEAGLVKENGIAIINDQEDVSKMEEEKDISHHPEDPSAHNGFKGELNDISEILEKDFRYFHRQMETMQNIDRV